MGNKFHEYTQTNTQFLSSLTAAHPQPQPLLLPVQGSTHMTPIIPSPIKQSKRKLTALVLSRVSESKPYNHEKEVQTLKMIVGVLKKRKVIGSFKLASREMIMRYNNTQINDVQYPLVINDYIEQMPYEERSEPYLVNLDQLPNPGSNMPNTWIYLGQWHEDFPHGIGKIYHSSFKYEGYVNRGIPHLKGRRLTVDDIYEGEVALNVKQGFGRLVTKTGYYYEGGWKDDLRSDEGYEIHKNGCVFEGEYFQDKVSKGSFYVPQHQIKKKLNNVENYVYLNFIRTQFKEKYYGTFRNNKFEGKGDYIWSDGRMYQGAWREGKMDGEGIFTWPNGKRYEGFYINNQKSGFGKFYSQPKIYEGYWEQGKPHGKGKLMKGEKTVYSVWFKGRMIKEDLQAEALSMLSHEEEKFPSEESAKLSEYILR